MLACPKNVQFCLAERLKNRYAALILQQSIPSRKYIAQNPYEMQTAKVYFKNSLAGHLCQSLEGYEFQYDMAYLSQKTARPISLTLPLKTQPYISDELFPFFDGLLPEGWLLDIALQQLPPEQQNRFNVLLHFCKDCVGAVSVHVSNGT